MQWRVEKKSNVLTWCNGTVNQTDQQLKRVIIVLFSQLDE